MGLGIALRAFSAGLFNKQAAERIRLALEGDSPKKVTAEVAPAQTAPPISKPVRSDAITLLAALQRDARLVDLVQENLTNYSDAQVGAAARPCLQQCASTLSRLLELAPVSDAGEGETVDASGSPARIQWIGEGDTNSGKLIHQGWQATKLDLPQWTGDSADANIIAPAQLQR